MTGGAADVQAARSREPSGRFARTGAPRRRRYVRVAFRAGSDNPVISYCDLTNGALKLAICGDPLCTAANATIATIDTGKVGEATSLALPPSSATTQTAVISYFARPDAPGDDGSIKLAVVGYRVASP